MKNNGVVRIRAYYPSFSTGEKRIADYMLANLAEIQHSTISELSNNCHTSTASISRFVKRIGYSSYRDFLFNLATTNNKSTTLLTKIDNRDSVMEVAKKTFNGAINSLQSTKDILSEESLTQASLILAHTKHVVFFGLGGSSVVAQSGYYKFLRTSLDCSYHPDFDIQLTQAVRMDEQQCAIVISNSGKNHQTLQVVDQLVAHHVPIIAITSAPESQLTHQADVSLISVAGETNHQSESLSSLMSQLAIMDSLFLLSFMDQVEKNTALIAQVKEVIDNTRK